MASKPSRNWCVTWNNPDPHVINDPDVISNLLKDSECISYAIWQLERGTSGTVHYQMYIELTKPVRFSFLKKVLGADKLHCEVRKGTRDQARDYCRKEDSRFIQAGVGIAGPFEYGEWKHETQGRRTDLEAIVDCAKEGKSLRQAYDVVGASIFRNAKYFDRARLTFGLDIPRVEPVVIVHWGESGTGKTHDAVSGLQPGDYFIKAPGKWWDGYEGQEVVIIDDVHPQRGSEGLSAHGFFLQLLDKYSFRVEIKGGTVPFISKKIYLTSNFHPGSWFPDVDNKKPLFRRIKECYHYSGDFDSGIVQKTLVQLNSEFVG